MPSRSALDEYSQAVDEIVHLANRELDVLVDAHRKGRLLKGELIEEMKRLTSVFGDVAAHAALEYYETERAQTYPDAEGLPRVMPQPYSGVYVEKTIGKKVDELWDSPEGLSQAMRTELERMVRNQGRRAIRVNMAADPKKPTWARVPRGAKTCAFCFMLASRGFAYESDKTAGLHDKFHKKCDCQIVPSFDKKGRETKLDGYDPDKMREVYKTARRNGDSPQDTLERLRRMYPAKFSDGIGEGGRSDGKGRGKREGAKDKHPRKLQPGKVRKGNVNGIDLFSYDTWRNQVINSYNALEPQSRDGKRVPPRTPNPRPAPWLHADIQFSETRLNHILYSDKTGGGHLSGFGWIQDSLLDKEEQTSEFPKSWGPLDVQNAVKSVLDTKWTPGTVGALEGEVNGTLVRVIISRRKETYRVITAYPLPSGV